MNELRVIGAGDIHYAPERKREALASLSAILATAKEREAQLVAIPGDLFDRGLQASDRDGYGELLQVMKEILDVAPIVAVRGTPSHDLPGCYEPLIQLRALNRFAVLEPGVAYCLTARGEVREMSEGMAQLMIFGIPEPGKEWLLANKNGLSRDEAAQAVVDALKALLLGLGGLRRQHPDIATVLLYHGSMRGATVGGGQLVGSEISVGREDLEMVGADLVLMGHIHEPQEIAPGIVYTGSAYPVDWAETTQRSFICAELGPGGASLERINFPHPPRKKIVAHWDNNFDGLEDVRGHQVWLVLTANSDSTDKVRGWEEVALGRILEAGALPGSRVTIEVKPTETVRAAEITEAQRLAQKLAIYASATNGAEQPAESVLEKAVSLEAEARAAGTVGAGVHIRIQRLRLRGAIGTWKGLGADEITLDLEAQGPGLLALVGPNGAGKTTLIENLHPYPQMLTREGSLQAHFRLKDSARELWFRDEATQTDYRALILIDATLGTPKAEYHLFRAIRFGGDGEIGDHGWEPLTNGRKEDYVAKVTELWGSIDMFLRSAFVSQKPPKGHPDLADATPAERKALFRELGGLDYLQTYAESAKGKADAADRLITADQARAEQMATELEQAPKRQHELGEVRAEAAVAKDETDQVLEKGKFSKALVADLDQQVAEQRSLAERMSALAHESVRMVSETERIEIGAQVAQKALAGKSDAERVLQRAADLERAKEVLLEARAAVSAERERLGAEHAGALAAHGKAREELQAQQREHERKAQSAQGRKDVLLEKVDRISEGLAEPLTDLCPTCGQELPEAKLASLRSARVADEKRVDELQNAILGVEAEILDAEELGKAVTVRLEKLPAPVAPGLPVFEQQHALDAVTLEASKIDIAQARETVRLADTAAEQIRAGDARAEEIGQRRIAIEGERSILLAQIDETIPQKHAAAKVEHERLQRAYAEARAKAAGLEAEVRALERQLADLEAKRAEHTALTERLTAARAELADWRYLERACGRDGIQALELDAMGPSIAQTANGLLEAAYGSRFRAEIRTTRIAGKGSKVKQVEDFEIIIRDAEHGTEQPLDTLSGGETVWIRKALYAAFGIIRASTTGTRFLTVCLDEADGALDPDARRRYVAMLQAEHQAAGRSHTIVISHSEEAQQAIGQRVVMADLAKETAG